MLSDSVIRTQPPCSCGGPVPTISRVKAGSEGSKKQTIHGKGVSSSSTAAYAVHRGKTNGQVEPYKTNIYM